MLSLDSQCKNLSNFMNTDIQGYCANVRSLPISNTYCSSKMTLDRELLHSSSAMLRKQC